ncbi:MAG TPA: hypothetical protein VLH40_00585, partial [Atribacteraceae bacterium]|nr:hypothetical protein [Atribacteraceae bacterium]
TTSLTKIIPQGRFFYFAHSYYAIPEDENMVVGITNYNVVIPAIIQSRTLWGLQFHPEKSSVWGMELLKLWLRESGT